ncbi:helix-turn-helix domain-containing protein [Phytohabitans rumicis]|uniref:Transcriptional regulator n=1 Tax=Phytohabitans rumicis TaxID=1076125 RepID=A0A6V8LDQ9_9ACTN|nr:helix-turn-helix transcriptional regulator [Phytohabitans rumicis]GFJ92226.1 transcriptional regulator [Phytohabitans rumicis]
MNSIEDWLNRPGGLTERLRATRRTASLTGTELARSLGWPQSKVSKIETGKQMPTDEDVSSWATACEAPEAVAVQLVGLLAEAQGLHQEWKHQVRLGQVGIQRNYDELARRATVIRNAEVVYIPGLLQTAAYARCRIAEGTRLHGANPEEIDAAAAERMRRQQLLYDTTKRFEFVITEAALRLLLCPRDVMLAQLDRLLSVTGLAHITFGIIPFGVELSTTPQNGFILFDEELAVVETFTGETMHHGDEAAAYARAMSYLLAEAAIGEDARRLVTRAIEDLQKAAPNP